MNLKKVLKERLIKLVDEVDLTILSVEIDLKMLGEARFQSKIKMDEKTARIMDKRYQEVKDQLGGLKEQKALMEKKLEYLERWQL